MKNYGLGNFLLDVRSSAVSRVVSKELRADAMNGLLPSEGGFALRPEFVAEVWRHAELTGQILSRCKVYEKTDAGRQCRVPGISETSRASGSRYGGLRRRMGGRA